MAIVQTWLAFLTSFFSFLSTCWFEVYALCGSSQHTVQLAFWYGFISNLYPLHQVCQDVLKFVLDSVLTGYLTSVGGYFLLWIIPAGCQVALNYLLFVSTVIVGVENVLKYISGRRPLKNRQGLMECIFQVLHENREKKKQKQDQANQTEENRKNGEDEDIEKTAQTNETEENEEPEDTEETEETEKTNQTKDTEDTKDTKTNVENIKNVENVERLEDHQTEKECSEPLHVVSQLSNYESIDVFPNGDPDLVAVFRSSQQFVVQPNTAGDSSTETNVHTPDKMKTLKKTETQTTSLSNWEQQLDGSPSRRYFPKPEPEPQSTDDETQQTRQTEPIEPKLINQNQDEDHEKTKEDENAKDDEDDRDEDLIRGLIETVMDQTGCSQEQASEALEKHDHNVVDAILSLENVKVIRDTVSSLNARLINAPRFREQLWPTLGERIQTVMNRTGCSEKTAEIYVNQYPNDMDAILAVQRSFLNQEYPYST